MDAVELTMTAMRRDISLNRPQKGHIAKRTPLIIPFVGGTKTAQMYKNHLRTKEVVTQKLSAIILEIVQSTIANF